ncbi:unnamed protein product [Boreogadus saida]
MLKYCEGDKLIATRCYFNGQNAYRPLRMNACLVDTLYGPIGVYAPGPHEAATASTEMVVLATTTGSGVPQLPGEPRLPLLLLLKDPALGSRCGRKTTDSSARCADRNLPWPRNAAAAAAAALPGSNNTLLPTIATRRLEVTIIIITRNHIPQQ